MAERIGSKINGYLYYATQLETPDPLAPMDMVPGQGKFLSAQELDKEINMDKPSCQLVGTDGNVFAIIGKVSRTLKRANQSDKAQEFTTRAFACDSYDDVLCLCSEYVEVE